MQLRYQEVIVQHVKSALSLKKINAFETFEVEPTERPGLQREMSCHLFAGAQRELVEEEARGLLDVHGMPLAASWRRFDMSF